jgi:2-phospho-L-lactate guanylyltransferase
VSYAVLIPVKASARGKSRLGLPDAERSALARAMALDTVGAVRAASGVATVTVLTEDGADADALQGCGVEVVVTEVRGLNETILEGARLLDGRAWTGPVAVLPGDLPFLTPADLTAALVAAGGRAGVVADADGTGTTLLVAATPWELRPRFGVGSYRRHRDAGAAHLPVAAVSTLHRDVDVLADLREPSAHVLLGAHTRAVVEALPELWRHGSPQVTVLP